MPLAKHEIDDLINCLLPYEKQLCRPCAFCKPRHTFAAHDDELELEKPEFDYCYCPKSKTLAEFRKNLEEKQKKMHYYLFKITKSHNMSEADFVEKVLSLPEKFKGWFKRYHFSIEFNVESGIVPHTHIVLADVDKRKDKLNKKHTQLVKHFSTPDNMVYRKEIDYKHYQHNVNYIKGIKSQDKQYLVDLDNNSRKKYNLDVYYKDD